MTKDKNVPHLEIREVVLVHCNIFNNNYQRDSIVLSTFVPNKPLGSLLEILPTKFIFLKTFKWEFQKVYAYFTNKNSQPLETEDRIKLTLVIKWYGYYKNALFSWSKRIYAKRFGWWENCDLISNKIADNKSLKETAFKNFTKCFKNR